jgi:hypothetical protein
MNTADVSTYLSSLSDDDLIDAVHVAEIDLVRAGVDEPNSEWHGACFTGYLLYSMELQRRGIHTVCMRDGHGQVH